MQYCPPSRPTLPPAGNATTAQPGSHSGFTDTFSPAYFWRSVGPTHDYPDQDDAPRPTALAVTSPGSRAAAGWGGALPRSDARQTCITPIFRGLAGFTPLLTPATTPTVAARLHRYILPALFLTFRLPHARLSRPG